MLAMIFSSTIVYLAGAIICGRWFYSDTLESLAQEAAEQRQARHFMADRAPLISDSDRRFAYWSGFWGGAVWPPFLLFCGIMTLFTEALPPVVPPTEKARLERVAQADQAVRDAQELKHLRELAKEHGLPTGDEPAYLPEP